jgi:protein-disulfide isomerase
LIAAALFFALRGSSAPTNNQAAAPTQPAAVGMSLRPVSPTEHIRGNPNASLVLVEYSDLECPFCKTFHTTMRELMDAYGKNGTLAWVYRHFPLDRIHSKARKEAEAAECAADIGGNTAFWNFIDRLFEITPANNGLDLAELPNIAASAKVNGAAFSECLSSGKFAQKVEDDYQSGTAAGASGTPFNILVMREKLSSADEAALSPLIAQSQGGLTLTRDKTSLIINGAYPLSALKQIIEIVKK